MLIIFSLIEIIVFLFITTIGTKAQVSDEEALLLKGVSFIETHTYKDEDNAAILKLYEGLRVA